MNDPLPTRPSRFPLIWFALVALGLAWLWLFSSQIRQMQFIFTYAAVLLTGIVFGVRWFLSSQRTMRTRLVAVVTTGLAVFGLFSTVRYRGMSGDWIPIVEWSWQEQRDWTDRQETRVLAPEVLPEPEEPQLIDLSSPSAFPGFLGANGDFSVSGLVLSRDWERDVPRQVWSREVGAGWSGFSIADGRAYTLEQRGDNEVVAAYDLVSGEEIWLHSQEAFFTNPMAGPGPRTTPSIDQQAVYTLGSTGLLHALDRVTGRLIWQRDVVADGGTLPEHGFSGSPLLVDDLVVVSIGGTASNSLVAYRRDDGSEVWSAGDDHSGYPGPVLATLAGVRQILVFNSASVAGHSVTDGQILWQYPWPSMYPNVATPLVIDGERVLFSTGYGIGAKLIRVRAASDGVLVPELVWESPRMKAKFTNLVVHRGYVYGLDDGVMVCLDPETGERMWKAGRYGHGNLLRVGDDLLVQTEKGELILVEASPQELREITRFTPLAGKAWNHFALIEPYLLVRNDRQAALWQMPLSGG